MLIRTATYLGKANKNLFAPRGLFAMVVTFQPQSASKVVSVNTSSPLDSVRQYGTNRLNPMGNRGTQDDQAHGAVELPTAAPLTFPSAAEMPSQPTNGFKRAGNVAADYFDRRARASYVSLPATPANDEHFFEKLLYTGLRSPRSPNDCRSHRRIQKPLGRSKVFRLQRRACGVGDGRTGESRGEE